MDIGLEQFISQHSGFLVAMVLWSYPWKGFALWRAARNRQPIWFIAMLIINSLAIIEITYLFYFSKGESLNLGDDIDLEK